MFYPLSNTFLTWAVFFSQYVDILLFKSFQGLLETT